MDEIFKVAGTRDKVVTVYIGQNKTLTIGDMTAKYSATGYSGISWIKLSSDDEEGKLAQITDIAIEDMMDDK